MTFHPDEIPKGAMVQVRQTGTARAGWMRLCGPMAPVNWWEPVETPKHSLSKLWLLGVVTRDYRGQLVV